MRFFDREAELAALARLERNGGLAVVWGRRRIGKTRLLLEWCERAGGVYAVADQSTPELQRARFARAIAAALPGFDDASYPDWDRLLGRLARDAASAGFRGPIIIDELPYVVSASPELPSILQRWIDHEAKQARLGIALAGSSQRMMQGLVLAHDAPLYGRAQVLVDLQPLTARYLRAAFGELSAVSLIEHWAAWGGVPRYWELAGGLGGSAPDRLAALALDPLGPLFAEPERLLLEELPTAIELRPVLDAIGAGAHRLSEIAGRIGRAATSVGKPLDRLIGMGLVRRETPHGDPIRGGKRSLYRIADPFLRAWFRVVAPERSALISGSPASRRALLDRHWDGLVAQAWEDLCRGALASLPRKTMRRLGTWSPGTRYWHGNEPEWDLVADALDGRRTLVGEVWFSRRPIAANALRREAMRVRARRLPPAAGGEIVRALFVPSAARGAPRAVDGVHVVTLEDML